MLLGRGLLVSVVAQSAVKAVDKYRLRPVFEVAKSELAFKVEAPGKQLTISSQSHAVLGTASNLVKLLLPGNALHRLSSRFIDLAYAELAIDVRATADERQLVGQHDSVVFTARQIKHVVL